ncbi:hypothetical protein PR048_024386 [Dryococelus australis]|uniref:Uncharacterized protein n=1 Tax=Dryococelus australis TaxID=614101 RepID=A0ABQ9GNG9_9NEOP|nr:hypothetical protein PR048_024386 [Dryococelus australis]
MGEETVLRGQRVLVGTPTVTCVWLDQARCGSPSLVTTAVEWSAHRYLRRTRKLNTISAYTRQKSKSKYRNHIRLDRTSQKQSSGTHKSPYDRVKRCRERKINIKASERVNPPIEPSSPFWFEHYCTMPRGPIYAGNDCYRTRKPGKVKEFKTVRKILKKIRETVSATARGRPLPLDPLPCRGEPGSIAGGVAPEIFARSAGFLGDLPFTPPFYFGAFPSPRFILIGSQDSDIKSRSNLSIAIHVKRHAKFALLFGTRLNFTVLPVLEPASFLHWLLHRCEATPFLTELHSLFVTSVFSESSVWPVRSPGGQWGEFSSGPLEGLRRRSHDAWPRVRRQSACILVDLPGFKTPVPASQLPEHPAIPARRFSRVVGCCEKEKTLASLTGPHRIRFPKRRLPAWTDGALNQAFSSTGVGTSSIYRLSSLKEAPRDAIPQHVFACAFHNFWCRLHTCLEHCKRGPSWLGDDRDMKVDPGECAVISVGLTLQPCLSRLQTRWRRRAVWHFLREVATADGHGPCS